ncbi:MAG: hypothetical protein U9R66_04470 [Thermodesulfobacteriota bacterium]|nr:hypothetical protein [Thermodesulfobacteriota bacterium]
MDIVIGKAPYVKKDPDKKDDLISVEKKMFFKDRRKKRVDRRKSNREGIFVSISTKEDRRSSRDRRKNQQ